METAYAVEETSVSSGATIIGKPKKKPNFIARWLWAGLKTASDAEKESNRIETISMKERAVLSKAASREDVSINVDPMYLKVWKANGGYIVETRTPNNDRRSNQISIEGSSNTKLHIITNDKDIGQEIGKIITLETLRA